MMIFSGIKKLMVIATVTGALSGVAHAASASERDSSATGDWQTLLHNGITRSYVVRVPSKLLQSEVAKPMVLVLHGGGGNAANAESMSGFTEKAAKEGFIVVYPEGTGRFRGKFLTWNAGHCCGYAMEKKVDDVGFIRALIVKLSADYPIDPRRIYATGMSNGGMMSHRLGIELSDKLAAIAPVAATLFGDEIRPAHPVSALMFNGKLDKSVPHLGGASGGRFSNTWDGTPTKPAVDQAAFWAHANGCSNKPEQQDRGAFVLWQYRCPDGRAVALYLIKDNGHVWPGRQQGSSMEDAPSAAINGTDVMWDFFKTQAK